MAKKTSAAKARVPAAPKGTRVIALQSFTDEKTGEFHAYGHEFEHPKGVKLDRRLADKVVRIDDRGAPAAASPKAAAAPTSEPAKTDAEA